MAFVLPPLIEILKWPKPNYVDPPTRGPLILASVLPFLVISTVVVGLRIISRAYLRAARVRVELDDWLMLIATILNISLVVSDIVALRWGWGRHLWDNHLEWLAPAQKNVMANELICAYTVGFTKLSILAFYWRVFRIDRLFRWLVLGGAAYVIGTVMAATFAMIFQCLPIRAFWDISVTKYYCTNMYAQMMSFMVLNSASDVYIFLLPIRWVLLLSLPTRQKAGLIITFCLGFIAVIIGMVRIRWCKTTMHDTKDYSWDGAMIFIYNAIESSLAIICASIPALRPLFIHMFPSFSHDAPRRPSIWRRKSSGVKELSRVWKRLNGVPVSMTVATNVTAGSTTVRGSEVLETTLTHGKDEEAGYKIEEPKHSEVVTFTSTNGNDGEKKSDSEIV